jgi:hypothetical protein
MNIEVQFLTHYSGNTEKDFREKERIAWASTSVEIEAMAAQHFETVLQDNIELKHEHGKAHKIHSYNDAYWVAVEATNAWRRGCVGSLGRVDNVSKPPRGLANFRIEQQRQFTLNAFGFGLFHKIPSGPIYTMDMGALKAYRPGDKIAWDDTPAIEAKARKYYEKNLLVVDDTVYCRIEPPCYAEFNNGTQYRVYTPYGGHGDPVTDFEKAYAVALDIKNERGPKYASSIVPEVFFHPIGEQEPDHIRRKTKAIFADLFHARSWFDAQDGFKRGKASKVLPSLQALWIANWEDPDDAVLDAAAENMLPLAQPGHIRSALEEWLDRPIGALEIAV